MGWRDVLLFFAHACWLGPIKAKLVAVIATIVILGLAARGLGFPDLGEDCYMVLGDIVGISAWSARAATG